MVFDGSERRIASGRQRGLCFSDMPCALAGGRKRRVILVGQHVQERLHFCRAHVAQMPHGPARTDQLMKPAPLTGTLSQSEGYSEDTEYLLGVVRASGWSGEQVCRVLCLICDCKSKQHRAGNPVM